MAIGVSLALFAILMAVISYFGYTRYARPGRVFEQLGSATETPTFQMPTVDKTKGDDLGLSVWVLEQIGDKIPINPEDASYLRRDMLAAGFRSDQAVPIYQGARVLVCAAVVVLALAVRGYLTSNPILAIVIPIAAGFLGWLGPTLFLNHLVNARHERIRYGLPDALDLMVVSVEAGLGLDQAIQYVARELASTHPDVCEELQLVNLEIRAGKRRVDALRNLGERSDEADLKKLAAVLIQTDRFGTNVAESLRIHSDFMRSRRRQDAEEKAGKVGVKLVFPIFFLILPAMMVVSAGPGLLQLFKYLFPLMRNFQGL